MDKIFLGKENKKEFSFIDNQNMFCDKKFEKRNLYEFSKNIFHFDIFFVK
jgi:hypothetical protein